MNKERIEKVAEFLESHVADERFDMGNYGLHSCDFTVPYSYESFEKCETPACIAGWTLHLFKNEALSMRNQAYLSTSELAGKILGLDTSESDDLFLMHDDWPTKKFNKCGNHITKEDAAKHLRSLLNE